MDKVLVVYASRMGSTGDIALEIGAELTRRGFTVDVRPVQNAPDARKYDAVVLGSAVYLRRWERSAVDYLKAQAPDLAERPTWLFQSGPCGPQAEVAHLGTPTLVSRLCAQIGLTPPHTFGGNLDPAKAKTFLARIVSKGDLAGDFRDWTKIRAWAVDIADRLDSAKTPAAV
jgi:menaquinone-dependent protoporphyrinogen oxidase